MSADFLLEIGCEEIPAWMLPEARASLKGLLESEFKLRGLLQNQPVETFGTPRRLVATCARLAASEPDRAKEVVGPPQSVAYDPSGKPTRAAESFARKVGLRVEQLKLVETPKGPYVAAVSLLKGKPTAAVLAEVLPGAISRINFPRTMYWTSPQGMRFIRPIRWIVALWGGRVVEVEVGGVRSGRVTQGHRFLSKNGFPVRNLGDYRRRLKQARVLVDPEERRAKILRESLRLLKPKGLRLRRDQPLVDLLVDLVEHPAVIRGEFNPEFLALPEEVLVTVMRHHQKYLSVEDGRGRLVPAFLAVIDLDGDGSGEIRRNHQAVLAARFRDAQFFWEADQKMSLLERVSLLEESIFESRLGTYAEKVARLVRLAEWLGRHASADGRRADIDALMRAARLCKSDLTTELVGEFPELQGIVGGLYARAQGEAEAVARAMAEHYRPLGADDAPPETLEGALLATADKLDTIVGCFSVGVVPTGSRDPFALRRAGSGIVRLIVERKLRLSIREAVQEAVVIVGAGNSLPALVGEFLEERARHLFREIRHFAYDEVNAAFAAGWDDLVDVERRLQAIRRLRPTADFERIAVAFKRIRNILEQAGGDDRASYPIHNHLVEAGAERELYESFVKLKPRVAELRQQRRYEEALREVASLRSQVDRYFDTVLVMAEDTGVRENRLALLARLLREFSTVADFSEIVVNPTAKG